MNLMVSSITFLKVIGHLHWNPLVGKGAASINIVILRESAIDLITNIIAN